MPAQPEELLAYAKAFGPTCTEVEARAALSRAYYAAYHATAAHLSRFPAEITDSDDHLRHREAWRRLKAWRAPEAYAACRTMGAAAKRAAIAFDAALKARALADYDLGDDVDHTDVVAQCARVRDVLRFITQVEIALQRKAG